MTSPTKSNQCQIAEAEDTIMELMKRIKSMEERSQNPELPEERRIEVETELKEIKKLLTTNKELLSKLHKENSKSFIIAAILLFLCFLIYGIYVMIYGPP